MKNICLLIFLYPLLSVSQPFDLTRMPFQGAPPIDTAFVTATGIHELEIRMQVKPDNKPMQSEVLFARYVFKDSGHTVKKITYTDQRGYTDSIIQTYTYNLNGDPVEVVSRGSGQEIRHYIQYDDAGRIREETVVRASINSTGHTMYVHDSVTTYSHWQELSRDQVKRIIHNGGNIPFREEINYYNDSVLTGIAVQYLVGGYFEERRWVYNEEQLVKQLSLSDGRREQQVVYKYGDGRLSGWEEWQNGEIIRRAELLWPEDKSWPEALVVRDNTMQSVIVYQFTAVYY